MASESARGSVESVEPSALEQAHARRVAESRATIPHVHYEVVAEVAREVATEALVRAAGLALREVPRVNGFYRDGRFELYSRVNVQVGIPVGHALVYPTIFDADSKGADEIGTEIATLAERARQGKITRPELAAGTFTIVDLGPVGITRGDAVIQRGQAAILTAGAVQATGTMALSLACDNRMLQGADAASFLLMFRELLVDV